MKKVPGKPSGKAQGGKPSNARVLIAVGATALSAIITLVIIGANKRNKDDDRSFRRRGAGSRLPDGPTR